VAACSNEKAVKDQPKFENKVAKAVFTGKLLARRAMDKGVKKVVFDRNGFLYHGRIKALSEGARETGLDF
jgi:large subunit ribosomal protein L18